MKKTLIILVTCITTGVFAQNEFPTSNAMWNESSYKNGIKTLEMPFGLLGDITINDTIYSKLYGFLDTILSEENIKMYIGALRNEGQKVFFRPSGWTHPDILLYDFDVSIGDTVWHNATMDGFNTNAFSIINSITIDENNRKIYEVSRSFGTFNYWIEGIGSDEGILRSLYTDFPLNGDSYNYNLNCFKHNDAVKYINNYDCNKCFCFLLIDILEEETDFGLINIYPNPTNYKLQITNYKLQITNYKLQILDILGREVFSDKITNENTHEMDISFLQNGVYFLKINNEIIKIIKN